MTPVATTTGQPTIVRRGTSASSDGRKSMRAPWLLALVPLLAAGVLLPLSLILSDWGDADRVIVASTDSETTILKNEVDLGLWYSCAELELEQGSVGNLLSGGGLFDNCENVDRVDNLDFQVPVRAEGSQLVVTEDGWQNVPAGSDAADKLLAARVLGIIATGMLGILALVVLGLLCAGLASTLAALFVLILTAATFTMTLLYTIFAAQFVDAYADLSTANGGPDYDLAGSFVWSLIALALLVPVMIAAIWAMHRAHHRKHRKGAAAGSSAEVVQAGTATGVGATAAVMTPHAGEGTHMGTRPVAATTPLAV